MRACATGPGTNIMQDENSSEPSNTDGSTDTNQQDRKGTEGGIGPSSPAPHIEPEASVSFSDLDLRPETLQGLSEMGYERPTKVQSEVFAHVREGKDLLVQSRTSTGKTAAFGIPLLEGVDASTGAVQALVLAPTRELANQVATEFGKISKHRGLSILPVYGGAPINPQIKAFEDGAQVVCGTPGRVLDHIRRKTMNTEKLNMLVFDEADEMLSMGFAEEIEAIVSTLPDSTKRQTLLFSATIPEDIERIANKHMREPEKISLSSDGVSVDAIEHSYYVVSGMARTRDLLKVLISEEPESAIIFCNTRDDTNTVARFLNKNGHDAEPLSSDLSQKDRERVMKRMRDHDLKYLVATDIAARGIDISQLSHVINYTFPESPEVYVHRTGRTGRAGKSGVALSLIGPREIGAFYYLKLIYKIRPTERDLPSNEKLLSMQEGEHYKKVVELVPEAPGDQYLSLARRLWDSNEGERVVGALLKRLLSEKPKRKETKEATDEPRTARRSSSRRNEGDRDETKESGDRPKRTRRRRRRGERDESRRDAAEATENSVDAKDPGEEDTIPLREDENLALDRESSDDRPKRKRRRRRKSRADREDSRASASTSEDGAPKEFWEAWADENKGDETPEAIETRNEDRPKSRQRRSNEKANSTTTRLYINIGKREEASADDVRGLVEEALAADADKIGSVAIRNTHSYVRVPNELVEQVIDSLAGKSFKERELVVERARR